MSAHGTLEVPDQLVDDVVADFLKVAQHPGPEEDLGVADAVAVLVDGGAQDQLSNLFVVLRVQLKSTITSLILFVVLEIQSIGRWLQSALSDLCSLLKAETLIHLRNIKIYSEKESNMVCKQE